MLWLCCVLGKHLPVSRSVCFTCLSNELSILSSPEVVALQHGDRCASERRRCWCWSILVVYITTLPAPSRSPQPQHPAAGSHAKPPPPPAPPPRRGDGGAHGVAVLGVRVRAGRPRGVAAVLPAVAAAAGAGAGPRVQADPRREGAAAGEQRGRGAAARGGRLRVVVRGAARRVGHGARGAVRRRLPGRHRVPAGHRHRRVAQRHALGARRTGTCRAVPCVLLGASFGLALPPPATNAPVGCASHCVSVSVCARPLLASGVGVLRRACLVAMVAEAWPWQLGGLGSRAVRLMIALNCCGGYCHGTVGSKSTGNCFCARAGIFAFCEARWSLMGSWRPDPIAVVKEGS
jgi:hypothetical protein